MSLRLNYKVTLSICIFCCTFSTVFAEDLAHIFNLAIEIDATLQQAKETQLATMELLPQARAGLLPTVSSSAGTNYNATNNPQLLDYNSFNYGITLSQPLFNLANWYTYQQSSDQVKSAIAAYEDAMQDLILRVVSQYFAILKALDNLDFAVAERKAFARSLEETKQRFDAGVIAITDVNEAQAKYDLALSQEIAAVFELYNQKELMGEITGVPAGNVSLLKPNISLYQPKPDSMEQWVTDALKQNFGLQASIYDMKAAKKNIDIQRAGHYPTLQADGSTTKSKTAPPSPVVANANSIGVTVTLPLFTGGSVNSKTRQAYHQYEFALQQAEGLSRQIKSNVRQAYRGVLTQISQVKALQQSVISSKSALDATSAAFDVGTRTIVDVLNAQSELLRTRSNLAKSRYDYIVASFRLKRYTGILTVEDINVVNSWLYPAPNTAAVDPAKELKKP